MKKSTIKRTITSLGLASLAILLAGRAHGSPVVNDSFDPYSTTAAPTPILTSTGNYTAFSGAGNQPLTVSGGTVNVSDVTMIPTGGTTAASGEDDRLTFSSVQQTGVLYDSTLVTVPTTSTFSSAAGDYFFSGYSTLATGGGYLGRVFAASNGSGGVIFGLSNSGTTVSGLTAQQSAAVTLGSEYRLVLRIDPTAHTATLGVQLASAAAFTSDSQLTITGGAASAIAGLDSVAIRQGSIGNGTLTVDGLQVGTTLADVSSIATGSSAFLNANLTTNLVPEPSTYTACAVGLLAFLGVQRMRRRAA